MKNKNRIFCIAVTVTPSKFNKIVGFSNNQLILHHTGKNNGQKELRVYDTFIHISPGPNSLQLVFPEKLIS